jgi:hypothetical protein
MLVAFRRWRCGVVPCHSLESSRMSDDDCMLLGDQDYQHQNGGQKRRHLIFQLCHNAHRLLLQVEQLLAHTMYKLIRAFNYK